MVNLINRLKNDEEDSWVYVYKIAFEPVARYILTNGGHREDAKDIFQDAMVVLTNKVHKPDFELTCKIEVFIYSIARNLWLRRLEKKSKRIDNEILDEKIANELVDIEFDYSVFDLEDDCDDLLTTVLEVLKDFNHPDCTKILMEYYFFDLSHKEISEIMKLSENYTKKKKYNCLDYLRKAVEEKLKG
jgi:RNA polymerase sigma factor (sigma-70 family)